jgi:hypothetical protein
MQRLATLGLEGQPASEVIEATATVWIERLSRYSPERLSIAFDALESAATRWPAPANLIELLPQRVPSDERVDASRRLARDPESLERSRQNVAKIIAGLKGRLQ